MKYKTFRGKSVDMEALRRSHEQTVAAGNMGVNAKGDKLGPGGEIIETAQHRTKRHYTSTSTSKSTMSVKGDQPKQEVFPDEKPKAAPAPKKAAKKSTKRKEKETPEGHIIIDDTEDSIDEG